MEIKLADYKEKYVWTIWIDTIPSLLRVDSKKTKESKSTCVRVLQTL